MHSKLDPIIAVTDVRKSSEWYQKILNCKSMHGGETFDILVNQNNEVLLCLHKWRAHEHPTMRDPSIVPGNGLILYLRTENMKQVRKNAESMHAIIEEDIHLNTNSLREEFSLRDPDGYYLTITEYHDYEG